MICSTRDWTCRRTYGRGQLQSALLLIAPCNVQDIKARRPHEDHMILQIRGEKGIHLICHEKEWPGSRSLQDMPRTEERGRVKCSGRTLRAGHLLKFIVL